jgi:SecD/SecF fusion protein
MEEATDFATKLKSGKLAAPARIVEEAIVGPSLGQEAINSGLLIIYTRISACAYLYDFLL